MIFKSNDMSKKIKAYFGRGVNKIEIEFKDEEDLHRLYDLMKHSAE